MALTITAFAFLIALLASDKIFEIFTADEYRSVSHLLPWVILSGGLFATGQAIALNLMSEMRTRAMVTVKISTAILGVILNFVGAYFYHINGIVIAGLLFSAIYLFWMYALSSKLAPHKDVNESA